MSNFRISLLVVFLVASVSWTLRAQTGEEEMTESSILDDTTGYMDDIVDRNLVPEQRFLSYEPIRDLILLGKKEFGESLTLERK